MKSMKKARALKVAVGLALLGGGGWLYYTLVRQETFFYSGTLEATRVIVPSRIASQIRSFDIQEGERLKKGQVLAELDDADLLIALKNAKSKYDRQVTLLKRGICPPSEVETLEAQKNEIELKIQWCSVRATCDGVVLSKYKEEGEWVSPGTGLLAMADLKKIWAFFYVEQPQIAHLSLGQTVQGIVPELPGKVFRGKIIKVNDEPEFTPKNVQTRKERTRLVYGVKVLFENEDEVLKPGMTIESPMGLQAVSS